MGVAEVRVGELGVVGELRGWFLLESDDFFLNILRLNLVSPRPLSFLLAALCSVAGLMWTEE